MSERDRIAVAVEAQIRHLRSVPSDVTEVPREAMAADLDALAHAIRLGYYADNGIRSELSLAEAEAVALLARGGFLKLAVQS